MTDKSRHYRIYDLMSPEHATEHSEHPGGIVYPKQLDYPIYSKHFRVDGERIKTIYYSTFDEVNDAYSDPIVKEDYVFTRDSEGLLRYVDLKISWMLKNDTWSDSTKEVRKYFNDYQKKLKENVLRRSNVIDEVSAAAADFGLASAIQALYSIYFTEIGKYKEAGSRDFFSAIASDTGIMKRLPTKVVFFN